MTDRNPAAPMNPAQQRALVEQIKSCLGNCTDEVAKQVLADLNAFHRRAIQNQFEARQQYAQQVAEINRIQHQGIREYGLQTLKWAFLLNGGAIALVLGGKFLSPPSTSSMSPDLLHALVAFALGCFFVVLAGAAGYFNFSYLEAAFPTPESLHLFLNPTSSKWPIAKLQKPDESAEDFFGRVWKKRVDRTRTIAIVLTTAAGICFLIGICLAVRAAQG